MILQIASLSVLQFKKIEHEGAGNGENKSPYWKVMQKPSEEMHVASYVKLLWYCQLQRVKQPSAKTFDLKSSWVFMLQRDFMAYVFKGL